MHEGIDNAKFAKNERKFNFEIRMATTKVLKIRPPPAPHPPHVRILQSIDPLHPGGRPTFDAH